jgi:hypothetical protein
MRYLSFLVIWVVFTACGGGSGGSDSDPQPQATWLIDSNQVVDGGPGKDGIPSIDSPTFIANDMADFLIDSDLVVGYLVDGNARALPHAILDWHEVVNLDENGEPSTLSYCPLTGTAALWNVPLSSTDKEFGVSGLLYNSNLILYDRETDSNWSQMLQQSVNGDLIGQIASTKTVIETTWLTWKTMYPETLVLSDETGFSRDYQTYPYGSFRTDQNLLFQVANEDSRLHPKQRVLGILDGGINKVYQIESFTTGIQVINENIENDLFVVIGSSEFNLGIAYSAVTQDGAQLEFTAIESSLPVVMQDNEGNQWDIFGKAVSGPRENEQLSQKSDFTAYWFAWAAFFPSSVIHSF